MTHHYIPNRIWELRTKAGMTQKELAKKAGIPADTIGCLERHERTPSVRVLLALANALGCHMSELLTEEHSLRTEVQNLSGAVNRYRNTLLNISAIYPGEDNLSGLSREVLAGLLIRMGDVAENALLHGAAVESREG